MAVDIAEFQWRKFLSSLRDAESELSGSISITYFRTIKNLISSFKSIKNRAREIDIMPHPPYSSEIIDFLYKLNDALAECRIFARECKELNKKLLLFNPFGFYFIQKMNNRLDGLRKELESLGDARRQDNDVGDCWAEEVEPPPCPVVHGFDEQVVYGFDEQAEKFENLLCGEGSTGNGFTTIGVVGIAGVGKTTLVHKVLKMERVKGKFNPIIWLPFSGMRKEEEQYSRFSFETCIFDNLGRPVDGRIVGLGKLLERLNQLFSGKRYLIVLDDVQRRHINIEDRLWRGLPKGSGGAVIVTSRLTEVARKVVEERDLIYVEPLGKEICWSVFQETLNLKNKVLNISHHETLIKIEDEIKEQCHGLPLAAKALAEIIPQQIREIESNRFFRGMYIPDELLKHDLDGEPSVYIPSCPVLVFVDIKDEMLGGRLYNEFCYRLNKKQVFAVLKEDSDSKRPTKGEDPEEVLKEVYGTLQKSKKYEFADDIQKRMRIIIVGGDDVVNWILGVICDLKLPESPSIVPISHGTEDNIPLLFGWKVPKADRQSVTSFLNQVKEAQQIKTDSWHILIKMRATQRSTNLKEILHSLHVFRPVRKGATETEVHKGDTETEVHKGATETEVHKGATETEVHKGATETEVHKGDTETEVHKGATETEVPKGDTETEVHKGATETEVHKGARETEVHKGATETEVHKGATETEVPKGDTETEVHKGATETEVPKGDTETEVHKGDTETEVPKGDTETEVHKGDTETEVHKGATETEIHKGATETEIHKGATETEVHKGATETEVHKVDTEIEVHKGDTETEVHKGATETEVHKGATETEVHKGATETEVHKGATETEVPKGDTETEVPKGDTETEDTLELSGGFWSYFSLGVDAPRSCGGYWSAARSLKSLVNVEVVKHGRSEPLKIPSGIKSIDCLNLPSDLGGASNMNKDRKNMNPSVINDGQLEIFGLKEVLLAQNERIYLDQVQEIHFEFKAAAESVKMRIDGSPWKQLPPGIIDIKISRHSQVNILANGDCAAKTGIPDSSETRASGTDYNSNVKDKSTEESSNAQDSNKERKKFGSADTFKYSETEDNSEAKDRSTEEISNA